MAQSGVAGGLITDEELKELVASLALSQKETDRQVKETSSSLKKTECLVREPGKQIGGLSNKFGGFTEGLALPSMTKVLNDVFKMEFVAPRVKRSNKGREMEVDVLGYANSEVNAVVVVPRTSRQKALRRTGCGRYP